MRITILKDELPAVGAKVNLVTKGVIPARFTRTADADGTVIFSVDDILPSPVTPEAFKKIPWLFMAYIDNSEHGIWKDQAFFELGKSYTFKLKKYKEVPTFFVKMQLRNIIGAELFSNLVTEVEKTALESAGLEVIKVKGQGTRTVEIQFKPPWHGSPLVIEWAEAWFCIKVLTVAAAIIAILVVSKWSFGEVGVGVAGGLGMAIIILALLSAPKVVKRREITP